MRPVIFRTARALSCVLLLVVLTAAIARPVAAEPAASPSPSPAASPSPDAEASTSPAAPEAPTETVLLPRGTMLVVKTLHGLNSYGSEAGTKVTYEVVQDLIVNGYVFAKAGDVAEGVIQNAQEGRNDLFSTRAANLRVSVDTVYNFCGDKISTDFVRSEFRQRQGLFGSHKDVEIIKGQKYQVPTERAQKVCAEKTTAQPLPIPKDALEGDKN